MAGDKEILNKIRSVKNMQKITSAMEMVAASKIKKAQDQMNASVPYADRIRRVISHLGAANPDYKHPFLNEREINRVGIIVIATDRGLWWTEREFIQKGNFRNCDISKGKHRS